MMPLIEDVVSDPQLPTRADAIVIGGGIAGVAAAYYLAKKGRSVALLEKGRVAGEQSSRNWGWIRQQNRDLRELPLMQWSLGQWGSLAGEIGADMGFRRTGLVYVTKDPQELATWAAWVESARDYQVHSRMLSPQEAKAMTPGNEQDWIGGVHSPMDGRAEPTMAAPALAQAARALGATVHQNCAVRGLDIQGGRVAGVFTEHGRIAADTVLCAGGAWTSMFCRRHGIDLPQAGIRSTIFYTTPAPEVTAGGLVTPDFTLTPRLDGSYMVAANDRGRMEITPQGIRYARQFWPTFQVRRKKLKMGIGRSFMDGPEAINGKWAMDKASPFERNRIFAPPPDTSIVAPALAKIKAAYPVLEGVSMARIWAGWIDSSPDSVPVISPVDSLPGFYLSTGFSGHGFGLGPGAGRLAADLMTGDAPIVDPAAFKYSRLVDGTALRTPGLM